MQSVGCVGLISNGPSRDIDAIRALKFQYVLSGASAGHGAMAVQAVNVPVMVAGMDVHPGEIVHMDENGACKFPADKIEAVLTNAKALLEDEARRLKAIRQAKTAAEVRAASSGAAYSAPQSSAPKKRR